MQAEDIKKVKFCPALWVYVKKSICQAQKSRKT